MTERKLYVNISSEQDLITLLGSGIVDELRALGIAPHGLTLGNRENRGLEALLGRHGIPLRVVPYARSAACLRLAKWIRRLRKIEYYARSPVGSTLHAKSVMGYRGGTYSLRKFRILKSASKAVGFLRRFHGTIIGRYWNAMEGLEDLDAPVISLDYVHNDDHLELAWLSRRRGSPYLTYVANLDQVTNYDVHLDIPDRILVWGEFHERVLVGRFGFAPSKISRVGFCRSDLLAGISAPAAGSLNVVYFAANTIANDPFLEENLSAMLAALEARGEPYEVALKKHPVNEAGVWERYLAAIGSTTLAHGKVRLVESTWDKYRKLEQGRLEDKDFSYRDLKALFASATHVFSAASTTTLEAAIAGAPAYFINMGGKFDGMFRFEHMRILMESGMVGLVREPADFARIFAKHEVRKPSRNALMENIGGASRAFAREVEAVLFPHDGS
jgi:hypothetical protein